MLEICVRSLEYRCRTCCLFCGPNDDAGTIAERPFALCLLKTREYWFIVLGCLWLSVNRLFLCAFGAISVQFHKGSWFICVLHLPHIRRDSEGFVCIYIVCVRRWFSLTPQFVAAGFTIKHTVWRNFAGINLEES